MTTQVTNTLPTEVIEAGRTAFFNGPTVFDDAALARIYLAMQAARPADDLSARLERAEGALKEVRALISPLREQGEDRIWRPAIKAVAQIDSALEPTHDR